MADEMGVTVADIQALVEDLHHQNKRHDQEHRYDALEVLGLLLGVEQHRKTEAALLGENAHVPHGFGFVHGDGGQNPVGIK